MINPNDFAPLLTRQSNKVRAQQPTGSSNKNHSDFFPSSELSSPRWCTLCAKK